REDSGDPHYVVIMMHDVTERHRLYQRLRRQALHDPLTQLPNRMMFLDRLQERFDGGDAGGRIGLCYLDLDGFKAVNDSLGHDVGDELLIRLANRLHERLVPVGHLVARMGGDEFVILVDDCQHTDDAIAVARSILDAVNQPVLINGHKLRATASVGVVERALDETDPADLMKAADITLYQAKISGKNRWAVYDADLDGQQTARHTLAATMPAALSSGELSIWYQPIVELVDGSPVGAEALIRWDHPEFGVLMPEQFLHLAEETGLIDQVGCWALGEACREAARWTRIRPERPPFLSLDLTAGQAREARIVEDVQAALSATGLPADRLQLELNGAATAVTEPVLCHNLEALAATGVRLAVDEFGTGTANLNSLRDLPVRALKLAGTFTAALDPSGTQSRVDTELVGSVIDLGRRLGLQVTAEGVDTTARLEQLQTMGCPTGQGALFPTGTAEEIERLITPVTSEPRG
ncbi:MAG: putative bifunctional diguanylate cyclase/phosphodiesterase, partial [Micromonosporaceae bacterium]